MLVYNYGPDINVVSGYSSRLFSGSDRARGCDRSVGCGQIRAFAKVQGNKLLVGAPNKLAKGVS